MIESKSRRIEEVKKDLSKQAPTMEESLLIHNIWNSQKEFEDEQGKR